MSLEEIESKLGSLIQTETITQLKSAVWKERLEGLFLFFFLVFLCLFKMSSWAPLPPKKGRQKN